MAVVTISRLLGSGGDDIAVEVAKGLDYQLVDNALIVKVAERAGVSVESAAQYDEQYQSRVFEWLKNFIEPRVGKILIDGGVHMDPHSYIEYCKTVIRGLAETGNVVIVGRASQIILKDFDNAFHVRIDAGLDFRAWRIMEKRGITEREALDMIRKSDTMKKNYFEHYIKADWNDPLNYHLILDSSRLGLDLTASVIIDTFRKFELKYEYNPGVRDRRKGPRRKDERRRGDRRDSEVGVSQKDITHMIVREGRPPRSHTKPDRRKTERRKKDRRDGDSSGSGS